MCVCVCVCVCVCETTPHIRIRLEVLVSMCETKLVRAGLVERARSMLEDTSAVQHAQVSFSPKFCF